MIKKITKSGNSASITLDLALLELIRAGIGDAVDVNVINGGIFILPVRVGVDRDELDAAAREVFKRNAKTFKKLAE
jgi:antitoxin component of MazEF toxin-antitoxin module